MDRVCWEEKGKGIDISLDESSSVVKPWVRKGFLFLLVVASAILISAAYPPFDLEILAWIGLDINLSLEDSTLSLQEK